MSYAIIRNTKYKRVNYFKFANPGNMRISIEDALKGGQSDPRNPILHKMFSYLGYGERAGSGLPMINNVWKEKDISGGEGMRAWKGYDFNVLNELENENLIGGSTHKAKSTYLTENGINKAKSLIKKINKKFLSAS